MNAIAGPRRTTLCPAGPEQADHRVTPCLIALAPSARIALNSTGAGNRSRIRKPAGEEIRLEGMKGSSSSRFDRRFAAPLWRCPHPRSGGFFPWGDVWRENRPASKGCTCMTPERAAQTSGGEGMSAECIVMVMRIKQGRRRHR